MIDGFDGTNWEKVGSSSIRIGLGKGAKGLNIVAGSGRSYGFTSEQASGAVFIIKRNPHTGVDEKVKVNKLRFSDDETTADLIYKLAVELQGFGFRICYI